MPPTSLAAPVITGIAGEGQIVLSDTGSWTGSPTGFSYQWEAIGLATNTTAPTITGTAQEGQTLTVSVGVWTENPSSYQIQWTTDA